MKHSVWKCISLCKSVLIYFRSVSQGFHNHIWNSTSTVYAITDQTSHPCKFLWHGQYLSWYKIIKFKTKESGANFLNTTTEAKQRFCLFVSSWVFFVCFVCFCFKYIALLLSENMNQFCYQKTWNDWIFILFFKNKPHNLGSLIHTLQW